MRVGWLFSMARSGSSVAAYAAAHPWGFPVADEVFGPWDRTDGAYAYPETQLDLMAAFQVASMRIDDETGALARRLFDEIGQSAGFVVCKSPHTEPTPEDVTRAFPDHPQVFLLRNPLHRLNSLYARAWMDSCGPNYDLDRYKAFARRWLAAPHRVVYDDLRDDPTRFFTTIWKAWGLEATPARVEEAVAYAARHYHDSSRKMSTRNPARPMSETKLRLPDEAIETYLADDEIQALMQRQQWSVDPAHYRRKGLFR